MIDRDALFGLEPKKLKRLMALGFEDRDTSEVDDSLLRPESHPFVEALGDWIGPYRLLSIVGEGGYGVVYLAKQHRPVKRRVALKIIKPGMDSKQVIARFEAERQALALLNHPHIAHIFDGGTTKTGRPYFVMEYVKGQPITEYCDQHKLRIEERLEVFQQVCEAVQHAHQKGVIHRDIKPSNILVLEEQDKAIPKIIDFGIAKAIHQPLTEQTLYTEQGQFIGTPEYMSPEQAGVSVEDIDTRTDIYALGVVLYELLTGTLPITRDRLGKAGFAEVQRIIRETNPPRPSTCLSRLGDKAKEVAERRDTEAAILTRCLRKELEWIPMKAMRKELDHRYDSASELADDIHSYLHGAPLIAGPESKTYRFKKLLKQYKAIVTAVMAVLMVLLAGIIVSTILAVEAHQQKQIAEDRELSARQNLYFARIGLAQQAWEDGNVAKMVSLLNSLRSESEQEDFRHFEWYYLWRLANAHHRTLYDHKGWVHSVAFSPSGDLLASGSTDKTIKVWNLDNGQLKGILPHPDHVHSLAFSPDGKTLLSGCNDGTVRLWDVVEGQERITQSVGCSVSSVSFSPEEKMFAVALMDGRIIVWELAGSKLGISYTIDQLPPSHFTCVDFSPDGQTLALGGGAYNKPCDILLWDIESRRIHAALKGHTDQIRDVEFSPDGQQLASASADKTVRLWDPSTAKVLALGRGHDATLWDVTFSPNGRYIATASSDYTIIMRDTNLQEIYRLKGHTDRVKCLSFSPDGKSLASASNDGTVKLWDIGAYEKGTNRLLHDAAVCCLSFSPDDKILVTGSKNCQAVLWDLATEQKILELRGHSGSIWSVGVSNDGKMVVTGSVDRTVKLWDIHDGSLLYTLPIFPDEVHSVAFSPGDQFLAVGCRDRSVILWDIANKKKEIVAEPKSDLEYLNINPVSAIAFSPDGKLLATGGQYSDQAIPVLWDVTRKNRPIHLLGHMNEAWSVVFSHDGRLVATASGDKTIKLWDRDTGKTINTLSGHVGGILSVAFSPDDKIIASGGDEHIVRIWDISLGEQRAVLKGHNDSVTSVAFSSDGTILATASRDQSVILWRATTRSEVDEHTGITEFPVGESVQSLDSEMSKK